MYAMPDSPGLRRELEAHRRRTPLAAAVWGALSCLIAALLIVATGEACTPAMRRDVATVTVDTARCVLEHLDLDPQGIALVCGVDALRDPAVIRLIASHQMALARATTGCAQGVRP